MQIGTYSKYVYLKSETCDVKRTHLEGHTE